MGEISRPSKYTEPTIQRLEYGIACGATYALACAYAGITDETLANWKKSKPGFLERIARAEGEAVMSWLAKIEAAANAGEWRAAAWMLERRYPREYGRSVSEIQDKNGGAPFAFTLQIGDEAPTTKVRNRAAIEAAEKAYFAVLNGTDREPRPSDAAIEVAERALYVAMDGEAPPDWGDYWAAPVSDGLAPSERVGSCTGVV